ncbi:M949_RS01915 family surface polysaccharide biosynthesis protein [Hymenobacter norwichensis]|uniref:M949_RS01915 family surface polysaccharide biosynthesis protein n=1 Tax=Hymenobacter norwichensis TaxID=223903 RepID=UPI0004227CDA|nr:hypothetical protein [Hymenobacter norwichensis]
MRQILCALLLAGLAACSDNASQQAQTEQPATANAPTDSVSATAPTTQLTPQAIKLADIPAKLRLPGQLQEAWRWTDANGENLLVVFRTVSSSKQQLATPSPDSSAVEDMHDFERTARIMARQYVRQPSQNNYQELWRLQDAVTDCALDMTLRLQPGSTAITDLDQNGRSETTLVYALACRGDISGADLKLIMRAGAAKYALRGSSIVQYDSIPAQQRQPANPCCLEKFSATQRKEDNTEGYYQTEAEFQPAPPAFLAFARQHWQKFSIETLDEHEDL